MEKQQQINPRTALAIYSTMLFCIIAAAYLRLIPTKLNEIPYYDSAGHFVLYGLWGWFFPKAFPKTLFAVGHFEIYAGICIIVPFAAVEECLQSFSPARTFDLSDFFWGFAGILLACLVLNFKKERMAGGTFHK